MKLKQLYSEIKLVKSFPLFFYKGENYNLDDYLTQIHQYIIDFHQWRNKNNNNLFMDEIISNKVISNNRKFFKEKIIPTLKRNSILDKNKMLGKKGCGYKIKNIINFDPSYLGKISGNKIKTFIENTLNINLNDIKIYNGNFYYPSNEYDGFGDKNFNVIPINYNNQLIFLLNIKIGLSSFWSIWFPNGQYYSLINFYKITKEEFDNFLQSNI